MTRIVVISNCQTRTLVDSLGFVVRGSSVRGIHLQSAFERVDEALAAVRAADVVVSLPFDDGPFAPENLRRECPSVIALPAVNFAGFHPDITYLFDDFGKTLKSPLGDYHSAIVLGGYRAGLPADRICDLFNKLVYSRLGYLVALENAKAELVEEFARYDLEVSAPLERWIARGCFMHTVNHPKSFVLADLAKQAAQKAKLEVVEGVSYDRFFPDLLTLASIYPVFPEIAAAFGAEGDYLFKPATRDPNEDVRVLYGLDEFVRLSVSMYEKMDRASWVVSARVRKTSEIIQQFA